ncbi:hypothetical protein [Pelagibacterium montanilacus]|uniref:hypothetical protein n=1 Tax=Pelagibacterium montanilacus TaxID=2185280 RepID=UPI000F8D81DD|nr:hypothetical protein [Pelagibacterium montanilacus]
MKKAPHTHRAALVLAAALMFPLGPGIASAQQGCWDNSAIQSAVASGEIQPVASVLSREGIPGSTEVLSVKVCDQGGSIVYVVAVLEADGQARNLTLNAR